MNGSPVDFSAMEAFIQARPRAGRKGPALNKRKPGTMAGRERNPPTPAPQWFGRLIAYLDETEVAE